MKTCSKCTETKETTEFYFNEKKKNHSSWCKVCTRSVSNSNKKTKRVKVKSKKLGHDDVNKLIWQAQLAEVMNNEGAGL